MTKSKLFCECSIRFIPWLFAVPVCCWLIGALPVPVFAQTEYDDNLRQSVQAEEQFRQGLDLEDKSMGHYRDLQLKELDDLERSMHSASMVHTRDAKINTKIASLKSWLTREGAHEAEEMNYLNKLDGWIEFWQSKRNGALQTAAWNQEQNELDQRAAEARELESKTLADVRARYQALIDGENRNNDSDNGCNSFCGPIGGYPVGGGSSRHQGGDHPGHAAHSSHGHSSHGGGGHR